MDDPYVGIGFKLLGTKYCDKRFSFTWSGDCSLKLQINEHLCEVMISTKRKFRIRKISTYKSNNKLRMSEFINIINSQHVNSLEFHYIFETYIDPIGFKNLPDQMKLKLKEIANYNVKITDDLEPWEKNLYTEHIIK